jgi:hypothetical protein
MSLKQFIQQDNIKMLWDVISEEDIFKFLTQDIQEKIYQLFINNIKGFYEAEKSKTNSLVDLNKKYIILILNFIKQNYPYQPSKIKIHNEQPIKESITYEEIQNDRRSQFDRDLTKRQNEFEDIMNVKVPPVPEFSDKKSDSPIKEMDKIIKEMQLQRNYEVEQINRTYNTSNNVENWLKPQETSLKNEKFVPDYQELSDNNNNINNRFKYLTNLDINLSPTNTKKVSFNTNDEVKIFNQNNSIYNNEHDDDNILSKLKKIKNEDNIKLVVNDETNEDKIYRLENTVSSLNEKLDLIINLLSNKIT